MMNLRSITRHILNYLTVVHTLKEIIEFENDSKSPSETLSLPYAYDKYLKQFHSSLTVQKASISQ